MYRQTHPGEPTEESRLAFEGRLFDVRVDTVRLANGRRTIQGNRDSPEQRFHRARGRGWERVHGEAVSEGAVNQLLLEVVAGGIDEGESAEEAARRELQ